MKKKIVTIIITTKNEEQNIERVLISVLKQTYKQSLPSGDGKDIEIVVVDNGSSDATKQIAKKYTKLVFNKGPERSAQRNFGAKKASGEYLLFLDADMELTPSVVKQCVNAMDKEKNLGALCIAEEPVANSFWEEVKAFERSFYSLEGDSKTDAARFFRKKIFWEMKGFDEQITGPEDWDLTERVTSAGYKRGWISEKIKHHESVPNPIRLAQKKYYYGLKSYRYLARHNVAAISPKTIYFLRPVFYRNWRRLVKNPILSMGLFIMFSFELVGGGMGFLVGKVKKL